MLYSIFFFFMYGTSFISMQYLNLYYKQIGFNSVDITKIIVISTLATIISSLYLGYKFDRTTKKHFIIYIILIGSFFAFSGIAFFESLYIIIIVNVIFSMFYCSLQPLITTITLENIKKNCINFGKVRLSGTLGYCVFSIIVPLIAFEKALFIFMAVLILLMVGIFTIILKTDEINKEIKGKRDFHLKEILSNGMIIKLMFIVCIVNITLGVYFNFFGIYYTEELGFSKSSYGVLCSVATLAEIPFLLLSGKVFKKFNIKTILGVSIIFTAIRWVLCFLFQGQIALILIQLLHGTGFIVMMTSINVYITNNCDKKYVATFQSLFFIGTLVFSKVIGSVLGGYLGKIISFRNVFLADVVICLIIFIYLLVFINKKDVKEICSA